MRLPVVVDALDGRRCGGHHELRRERHTIGEVAVHGGATATAPI
jgi:hypothetical protein